MCIKYFFIPHSRVMNVDVYMTNGICIHNKTYLYTHKSRKKVVYKHYFLHVSQFDGAKNRMK